MRTQTGNQKGFSLIELMVVVGIIGILAAIAVPNYQKFQAKSRQTEAKSNLGGIYTAEKAFYAEWNTFLADFRDIGFAPEGNLRYDVGFSTAGYNIPANNGYTGPSNAGNPATATSAVAINAHTYCKPAYTTSASTCTVTGFAKNVTTGSVGAGGQTFIAQANGNVDADTDPDTWTIDQSKVVKNTAIDLLK